MQVVVDVQGDPDVVGAVVEGDALEVDGGEGGRGDADRVAVHEGHPGGCGLGRGVACVGACVGVGGGGVRG